MTRSPLLSLFALVLAGCPSTPSAQKTTSPDPAPLSPDTSAPLGAEASTPPARAEPLSRVQLAAIVAAEDRDPADREVDIRRAPVDMLLFTGIAPGMKVADIGAGMGYTTELLARAVGPTGAVYGQNPAFVLERFAEKGWSERLAKPVMANVVRLDREFVDPFPADLRDLDVVLNVLFYHDFAWMNVDRSAHNAAVFHALRPGGVYVLIDHSAMQGAGVSGSQTLHRIEESVLRLELEAAGFELDAEAEFLRNPSDTRDWNALPWRSEREELSDRFVLRFRKPLAAR